MKLLIIQSSPDSCHFFPLGSKYSRQQLVHKRIFSRYPVPKHHVIKMQGRGGEVPHQYYVWIWEVSITLRSLYPIPWKDTLLPIRQGAGWTPQPVWTWWRYEKFIFLPGIEPRQPSQ
jgi:hypothetical protein